MSFLRGIKKILSARLYYFFRAYFEFPLAAALARGASQIADSHKEILIIRTDHIGDFVLFSPAFRVLKDEFPEHRIVFLGDKNITDLIKGIPGIDEFIPLDVKKFQFDFVYYLHIFKILRKRRFDQVIYPVYSRSFFGDELVRMSGADVRIGFMGDNSNETERQRLRANAFYTKLILSPDGRMNEIDRNKAFFAGLGVQTHNNFVPAILVSEEDKSSGRLLLKSSGWRGGPYVMVNPGSNLPFKNWPRDRFADVAHALHARGFEIVVTGSKNERVFFDEIQGNVNFNIVNLIGKTSLIELAAVASQSVFYLGTDTGSMHIAAAMGVPVVGIVGGGHYGRFFPYGDLNKNRAVHYKDMKCRDDNWECAKINGYDKPAPCILGITVKDVLDEIDNLLDYLVIIKE